MNLQGALFVLAAVALVGAFICALLVIFCQRWVGGWWTENFVMAGLTLLFIACGLFTWGVAA